ncbi:MAG: TIGR03619 family F420-dependent LLM class oxidoreductase [Chloroflexota bacterium]|nr:MAG: TIGR03619 family F420-dependent LLM class oxidoreductase [Chloroflexota bacterium]
MTARRRDGGLQFGLYIANAGPRANPRIIRAMAREAESRGFDGCWTNEHPMPARKVVGYEWPTKHHYIPHYDVDTTLAYIAGQTTRVRLGCSIHVLPYHSAIWLAKRLATLDQLSDGRAILGVGVGWNRQEARFLGFDDFEERGKFADEALEVIRALWTERYPSYQGRWHSFEPIDWRPKPLQKPHPPIWIGGESMPAIRRAARFGNGWLLSHMPLDWVRQHLDILRDLMAKNGRDPAELRAVGCFYNVKLTRRGKRLTKVVDNRKSMAGNWMEGPTTAFVDDLARFRDAGLNYPILRIYAESGDDLLEQIRIFDEEVRQVIAK